MTLYTRTGDRGQTSLLDGSRVAKNDPRVEAYGQVDELNSLLGWCGCILETAAPVRGRLEIIQRELFGIGAELAGGPDKVQAPGSEQIRRLEKWIDEAMQVAGPIAHFVLPGGTEPAGRWHMARACCRRVERAVVAVHGVSPVRAEIFAYLNRLSDLLFAWARQANEDKGVPEVPWTST